MIQQIIIRQGLPKKRRFAKSMHMKKNLEKSIKTNFLGLTEPNNSFYGIHEMQMYFLGLIAERGSGNLIKDIVFDKFKFNQPDQQTVRVRSDHLDTIQIEEVVNHNLREFAKTLPTYQSEFKLKKIKRMNTQKRRSVVSKLRKRQRERNIDPPEGRYLSIDFTLQPNYSGKFDFYRQSEHPMAFHLTKDRRKKSTTQFLGYHAVYDYELGSRQVLGVHMLTNYQQKGYKDGWRRESLGHVTKLLIDPIVTDIAVTGVVFDGDYYSIEVMKYLEAQKLDYVIRASTTPAIKQVLEETNLESKLVDGQGFEVEQGNSMENRYGAVHTRLVIVKRGQELTPLVLPKYSKLSPEQALLVYEERFGIETAYRELYKYLPATCSISPNYRLALYAFTAWFFNLMLNYYEIVVVWSKEPTNWDTSLSLIHSRLAALLGQMMLSAS